MGVTIILVISILLQFAAAILALRLIWITGRRTAWVLVASALFLMAIRRCLTLFQNGFTGIPSATTLEAELVALVISILMLSGVIWIAPLFTSVKRSEEALRGARDELEIRVQERTVNLEETDQKLVREIAEHKKAQDQITHLASFPELNPNPVLEMDMAGNVKYMNPATEALFPDLPSQGSQHLFLTDWDLLLRTLKENNPHTFTRDIKIGESWYEQSYALITSTGDVRLYARNITDRKHAEEALRQSELDLNHAQAVAHTGSWRLDVQRNQLLWSDETHRIFGIPRETPMTYETFLSSVHPDDREYIDQKWQVALRGEPYDNVEHRIIVEDEVKWVRERAELEFDTNDELKGGFGTVQDITERKRLVDELRVKDYAIASTINGIAIADLNGSVTYVNPACLNMWNYEKEEEILGKHASTFFADENEANMGLNAVLEEGAWQSEIKARRRDGSLFDIQVLANLVTDADGKPFCSMASFVDITETKQILEALKREEQVRYAIMENTGTQLAYLNPQFNFIMVNSAYADGSGHTEEELIGKNHFTLFPDEENQAIFEQVRDTGKSVVYHDRPFEFKDQPERGITYWDWTLTPVKDSLGEVQGLVLSLIDTTAHKKVEDLKDTFIGMVSHELRTPLTVISGCLSTILTEWDRLSSSEIHQLLRDAVLESESLSHLIENLLELSRFQAQQLTLYVEPVNVRVLVTDTINKIKRQAQSYRFAASIPVNLMLEHADPLRIERILYNLLENATKYSPSGSQIKVSAMLEPERLVISVRDQGRGLSVSEQTKLFTPFWRLEETQNNLVKGAGLGLVVCRVLVEAHGGEIWVESKKGKGSTFYFSLPAEKSADERTLI